MAFKPGSVLKSACKSKGKSDMDEDDMMINVKKAAQPGSKLKNALRSSKRKGPSGRRVAVD